MYNANTIHKFLFIKEIPEKKREAIVRRMNEVIDPDGNFIGSHLFKILEDPKLIRQFGEELNARRLQPVVKQPADY